MRLQSAQAQPQQIQYSSLPLQMSSQTYIDSTQRNAIECPTQPMIEPVPTIGVTETNIITATACNYRNCTMSGSLNSQNRTGRPDVVFQTPQHTRVRRNYDKDIERSVSLTRNQSSNAILPPPLFDETNVMSTNTLPLMPNDSMRQLKSRRHHRTIPRHFTVAAALETPSSTAAHSIEQMRHASDDELNRNSSRTTTVAAAAASSAATAPTSRNGNGSASSTNNKKSICQCPVQHVPMTYMGSSHLNMTRSQPSDVLMSTLSRKGNHHRSNVAKSASFTTTPATVPSTSVVQSYHRNSASGLLSASTSATTAPSTSVVSSTSLTSTQNSSLSSTTNANLHRQKTPQKIQTISKQIGNTEYGCRRSPTIQSIEAKEMLLTNANQLSQMRNEIPDDIKPSSIINSNEMYSSPFPIQFIESIGKNQAKDNSTGSNPALPPKLCKLNNGNGQSIVSIPNGSSSTSSRIQTISKPMTNQMNFTATSMTSSEHGRRRERRSKSPSRDKSLPFSTAIALDGRHFASHQGKTAYPPSQLPMSSSQLTLPKSSTNALKNNALTEAINKLPTTVNISSDSSSNSHRASKLNHHERHVNALQSLDYQALTASSNAIQSFNKAHASASAKNDDKPLPVCTTYTNCSNPKEHFLPNDTSLDDDYLSECENCKSAHGSRYFLDEEIEEQPQETMTLQRKMDEKEDEQPYYRTSSTLPTNTKQKTT